MSMGDTSSEADLEGPSDFVNGTGRTTNVRGKGTCTWMGNNKKETLEFNERGVSVGSNDGRFARYLGGLARDKNVIPLVEKTWRKVLSDAEKNTLWGRIHATIEWKPEYLPRMPLIKFNIMERVATSWKSYKNRLKTKYYKNKIGTRERWVCGDKDVDLVQWRQMVRHWDKERTRGISEKNSTHRKGQKYNHTSGTKSYARSRAEYLKKHGHEPDPIQFFVDKHTRNDEQKSWIDEGSERKHADMQERLAVMVTNEGTETTEMREKAYVASMGPEKRYRVRGYGPSVTPDMIPYVHTNCSSSSHRSHGRQYARLQSELMELESRYQQQQEQAHVQQVQTQVQLERTQQELAMLKQMIQSKQSTPPSQQLSQPLHQPFFQMPSYPPQSQQSAPPSQQPSQPLNQPLLQMPYPPQMYWPQMQPHPQMPYQPQHLTTGLTGLLMGDTSVQENELLNQLRDSSNQSSRGSE